MVAKGSREQFYVAATLSWAILKNAVKQMPYAPSALFG
jgi:hypothetical protein